MKPIDLFDAMDGISETYIREAERAVERHAKKRNTAVPIDTAAQETPDAVKHLKAEGSIHSRKPVWQRISTGIAAAAACAVFVGGGWFIVQQKKPMQPDIASNLSETCERNLLGGSGTIRIAGNMDLLYDDEKVYPRSANYEAARSAGVLNDLQNRQALNDIFWDGEQLYHAEGNTLYRIDSAGNHIGEEPFFTIDFSQYKEYFPDSEIAEAHFIAIQKLTNGENGSGSVYFLGFHLKDAADQNSTALWYAYDAETGQQELLVTDEAETPEKAANHAPQIAACDSKHAFISCDDCIIDRVGWFPFNQEPVTNKDALKCGGTNWMTANGSLYLLMHDTTADNAEAIADVTPDSYGKFDSETGVYTEILHDPDFTDFIPYDGKIYAMCGDSKLICADPEWNETETIFDFSSDLPKEITDAFPNAAPDQHAAPVLEAVDETYLLLNCPFTNSAGYLLIDRQTDTVHYLCKSLPENGEQDTPQQKDSDAQSETVNVFGGSGTLYPVCRTIQGDASLYRDNNNYYYFDGTTWFQCPITGNQFSIISDPANLPDLPINGVISDGERIYTPEMEIVSEGSAENQFDPSAVQAYLNNLNEQAESKGWHYDCDKIWHIRDRYFIIMKPLHILGTEPDQDLLNTTIEIWTDNSGIILSDTEKHTPGLIYYCSDDKRNMYVIEGTGFYLVDCPGYETDEKPDPEAYGEIREAYSVDEDEYYLDTNYRLYTRENGEPVLMDEGPVYSMDLLLAPDHRVFYSHSENHGESLYLWNGGGNKTLIYKPENNDFLMLCGFEPNASGGYSIVLFQWGNAMETSSFVFIDPDTGQIVKQLSL
ncbi:MAG TPA: hypothetical protein DCG49_10995 [Ruminococcus sp.]|nr:hypothetical protein [Ruminococcus sp.]